MRMCITIHGTCVHPQSLSCQTRSLASCVCFLTHHLAQVGLQEIFVVSGVDESVMPLIESNLKQLSTHEGIS